MAKKSVMTKHMIEDSLASRGLILLSKVPGNIFAKILEYYKHVVTQLSASENDVNLKAFVSGMVNEHEETLFGLLVAADYLDIKDFFSLAYEDFLDMIKRKDQEHITGFQHHIGFFPRRGWKIQRENPWAFKDDITFEVDEAMAKQTVTIKHMIEHSFDSRGPILIPRVTGNILAKDIEYCKCVVTQPPAGENNVDLKAIVSSLVNDNEEILFRLLVALDYLDIKGLLSLACEDVLDMIKWKDHKHIRRIFNITPDFSSERRKRYEGRIRGISTKYFCLLTRYVDERTMTVQALEYSKVKTEEAQALWRKYRHNIGQRSLVHHNKGDITSHMVIWNFSDNTAKLNSQPSKQQTMRNICLPRVHRLKAVNEMRHFDYNAASMRLIKNPTAMDSSSSSRVDKVILQSIEDKTFEVDELVAKQSMTIEHLIEDSTGPVVIPNVSGYILTEIVRYCKRVVTQPILR
ncbi:hypothetical protein M9H77_11700 [Catharanthus roseus]|uniref:Uncharacterized protein n=1 Tax=Catharanthus roseus TaxID=4058 RepID=A0ACC0BFD8_CATRO|nr:hypothetical protein M9H77_11700 [Catharanthus roseus]